MEQSSSCEVNLFSASQKIPRILWKPKVYYRVYKSRHLSFSWARSIQPTSPSHFQNIHLNIIFSSTPGSSKRSLSLRFSHQNPICNFPLPLTCHMPCPPHSYRFDDPNNIRWGVQTSKLLIMQISLIPCYLAPPRPKYSPQHPILKHPQPTLLPQCGQPNFTHKQNNGQNWSSVYFNL